MASSVHSGGVLLILLLVAGELHGLAPCTGTLRARLRARIAPARRGASVFASTSQAEAPVSAAPKRAGPAAGAWLPVGSIDALSTLGPTRVEIASRQYVVWEHEGVWSVLSDACPHRLAPLSQGHVDKKTGCIECPYHGW